ncbi:glycosyltransferase family 39 protein [Sphingomicrobium sp. XHP0239]|uniref:glycosyltransferase family 39 protein n=1 Tax=Sphingomicrobium maritimum TaxID=3133972 RepID=UPI0031CC56F3
METQATERAPLRSWWAWLAMIVVVGGVLRLVPAPDAPLWGDEALSLVIAHFPATDLLFQPVDPSGGLYYLVQKAWLPFGTDPVVVRLPSILFGTLTIVAAFALGAAARDARTGLWCAAFFAVSPMLVVYAKEARTYALMLFLLTTAAALTVHGFARQKDDGRWLVAALVTGVLALYAHPTAWLVIAPLALFGFALRTRCRRGSLLQNTAFGAGAFILSLPELRRLLLMRETEQFSWLRQANPIEIASYLMEIAFGWRASADLLAFNLCLFIISVGAFAYLLVRREARGRSDITNYVLLTFLLIYPLLLYVVGGVTPIAMLRTSLPFSIGFALWFGLSIRTRMSSIAGAIFILAIAANQLTNDQAHEKRDWRAIATMVNNINPNIPLLICADYLVPSYLLGDRTTSRDVYISGNSALYRARKTGEVGLGAAYIPYWRARVDKTAPRPEKVAPEIFSEALYLSVDCHPVLDARVTENYGFERKADVDGYDNLGQPISISRLSR